jgi:GUN4-like
MSEQDQPEKFDVVLGGENVSAQPPSDGAVLGTFSRFTINLQQFLQQQRWQEADLETTAIMLAMGQRGQERFLRADDLHRIDCTQLRAIDNLWKTYSSGHFGLSTQAAIWRSVCVNSDPDWEAWCRFGNITGWCVNETWLYWDDVDFDLSAPRGHLPRNGAWQGWGLGDFWVGCRMLSVMAEKLENCQII